MKYDVGKFIVLTAQPDGGIWDGVIGIVINSGGWNYNRYIIDPVTLPSFRSYVRQTIIEQHSFDEVWVYTEKSDLLNYLLGRS